MLTATVMSSSLTVSYIIHTDNPQSVLQNKFLLYTQSQYAYEKIPGWWGYFHELQPIFHFVLDDTVRRSLKGIVEYVAIIQKDKEHKEISV